MEKVRYKEDDYIYASAYIRCREKYLLSKEGADRMIDGKTPEDALKVLYELDYGEGSEDAQTLGFEALLSEELEKTLKMILSLAPNESYFTIFLYPNDYHNIKTLLKAEFLGVTVEGLLVDAGSISPASLTDLIQSRNYSAMRPEMAKGIQEAIETFGRTLDPQTIDLVLDQACFRDMNIVIARLKNDFVKGFAALKIDLANLKSFVRVKEMKKPLSFFSKIFIEGGDVPERVFTESYGISLEQFAEKPGIYNFHKALKEGASMIRETGRFTALEKLCDNLLMEYVQRAKYISVGPEVLVAYMAAKESDIRNARIIVAGKLAGLPPEQIRERVRKAYV